MLAHMLMGEFISIQTELSQKPFKMSMIPGVLILENNRTYGKKRDKHLYRFRCNDTQIADLLVPYIRKKIGFSKKVLNMYVIVQSTNDTRNNHQLGVIYQIIGDVDKLENFYEYSLWCKQLKISYKQLQSQSRLQCKKHNQPLCVTTDAYVISIDPQGSKDIDDAFSITLHNPGVVSLYVYIADVPRLLTELDLWDCVSDRVSTIYLPNGNIRMLPEILSEDRCSLLQSTSTYTLYCKTDIHNGVIVDVTFGCDTVNVTRNYSYNEIDSGKTKDNTYKQVKDTVTILNDSLKYVDEVCDSHDVIAFLMIHMNCEASKLLSKNGTGIFRNLVCNNDNLYTTDDKEVNRFLKGWNSLGGKYSLEPSPHDLLNVSTYTHTTSPIRRLVDLLNIIEIRRISHQCEDEKAQIFYDRWCNSIDKINNQMKAIKRVQIECNFLNYCFKNPNVLNSELDGYICDKDYKDSEKNKIYYTIYLPKLKIVGFFSFVG